MSRAAALAFFCATLFAQTSPIAGDWNATLQTPGGALKLILHISADGPNLAAKLDSVSQGAMGIPIDQITFTDSTLRFVMRRLNASFEGKLSPDRNSIEGAFTQGMPLPLTFTRGAGAPLARPQEPQPPFPYLSEDVTFENKAARFSLAGTLTRPQGKGPFPAAILISGSGPQDRDSAIMGHKPFAVLADHLTRQGIAVLRYDDRGFGKSGGAFTTATTADFASDASAALDFLLAHPAINPAKIALIGHSEGGLVAPLVASTRSQVAFVVLLAAPGVTGEKLMLEQGPAVMRALGAPPQAIEANAQMQRQVFAALREDNEPMAQSKRLSALLPPGPASDAQIRQLTGPWMSFFRAYDPSPALQKTKCPVLVLNGALDTQVLPEQNLPAIEAALQAGGNKDYRIEKLPGLNHLLQTARTGAPPEYAQLTETMAPSALQIISTWLRAKTGLAP